MSVTAARRRPWHPVTDAPRPKEPSVVTELVAWLEGRGTLPPEAAAIGLLLAVIVVDEDPPRPGMHRLAARQTVLPGVIARRLRVLAGELEAQQEEDQARWSKLLALVHQMARFEPAFRSPPRRG